MAQPPRHRSGAAVQARTQQLLERDPDYVVLKCLPEASERSDLQQRQARDLETRLSYRYGAAVMPWPITAGSADYKTRAADFEVAYLPAEDLNAWLKANPSTPGRHTLLTDSSAVGPIDPLMAKDPPRLRIMVRLDLVTTHDIERLARHFRAALKAGLQQSDREQHALRWLRTVKPVVFNRDLRRYDLHRQQGLTFRQIAYLEREERRGRPLMPGQLRGMPVRIEPGAESSVRASVQRIYRSIYRVPYHARRLAPDHSNVSPYECPTHPGGDCPLDCPMLLDWVARIWPSLPKPDSGT
jgi:hypothetical protein